MIHIIFSPFTLKYCYNKLNYLGKFTESKRKQSNQSSTGRLKNWK